MTSGSTPCPKMKVLSLKQANVTPEIPKPLEQDIESMPVNSSQRSRATVTIIRAGENDGNSNSTGNHNNGNDNSHNISNRNNSDHRNTSNSTNLQVKNSIVIL